MGICLNRNHQDNQGLPNVICLGVQIKGGHHIGHLLESNLSRHTVIFQINGSLKRFHSLQLSYTNDGNMDTVWRRVYHTYPRDSGQVHYKLSHIFLIQRLSQYGEEPQQTFHDS